jgi:Protein of unknown function (DUF3306)
MSGESNFLSRWSRLKREAKTKSGLPQDGDAATVSDSSATPAELTPEELAALPRIEELTAETDLSPFMRVGVPAGLRNAALRRMWSLDPAIRDRVGDALDYAYDWNSPGGVPGAGQLLATDDVEGMLRSVIGEREEGDEPKPEQKPNLTSDVAETLPNQGTASAPPVNSSEPREPLNTADAASQTEKIAQVRRHGGATPF